MKKRLKPYILMVLTVLVLTAGFLQAPKINAAKVPEIKMKYKRKGRTSVKIKWSGGKKLKYWRIRRALTKRTGGMTKYKTIKVLKRSQKTYTITNLKKNKEYIFEITGGKKKNNKYKPASTYEYIWSFYTGMADVIWDDYAASDAPCSTTCIELWGGCESDGLPIKGYEIYRKKAGDSEYKKIAVVKDTKYGFRYKDKDVSPGAVYKYKFRSYGVWKKKKLYSRFSEVLARAAINQSGIFTSKLISSSSEELVVRVTSAKYNAALVLRYGDLQLCGEDFITEEYFDMPPAHITGYSKDNESWTELGKTKSVTLKGGESIYLKLRSDMDQVDMRKGTSLWGYMVTYEGLPCFFDLPLNGTGTTKHNDEGIH